MWANRSAYRLPFPEAADELFASGDAPPCIVVFVDAWTAYGGSQFVDSPGTGRYHTYLCDEVVPFVDSHYRTLAEAGHRGVQGKSSGGFGAMITPMLRPDLFGAMATHAGDAYYELLYFPEFGKAVRALREYDGSIDKWWDDFRGRVAFTKGGRRDVADAARRVRLFFGPGGRHAGTTVRPQPPGGSARRTYGNGGWTGTRCGWCPSTLTRLRGMRAIWVDGGDQGRMVPGRRRPGLLLPLWPRLA